jgi:hypothetical protein
LPVHFIESDVDFNPIEDIEETGEIKYTLGILDNKEDFINYIDCTMNDKESFDFTPIIKSNLNNLIQFIGSFQNFHNQTQIIFNKQF